MQVEETIVATASTHDSGGLRGIVRISGQAMIPTVSSIFQADAGVQLDTLAEAVRVPGLLTVREPIGSIPCDLYLWPTNRSYTKQPTAELHTFGALPLLNAIVETVCEHGARLATPGEFTLRSFLAGRIDLAQAEAVLGVIDAADQRELNVALSQLAGGLSQPLDAVRNTLLNLCADLEAGLDFVEDDIEFISQQTVELELSKAGRIIEDAEQSMHSRGFAGQLPRVVLRGEPNTGKSSLWNALCVDEQAIVTEEAGTTRDYLTGTVAQSGVRFELVDTAGVEHSQAELSLALRQKTDEQVKSANLILLCIDSSRPLTNWERSEMNSAPDTKRLVVLTKCDLPMDQSLDEISPDVRTSESDLASTQRLIDRCSRALADLGNEAAVVASTAVRCRESLRLAKDSVQRALALTKTAAGDELVAAEVRTALDRLGQIVGAIYTDDILDRVFSRFCIGK